MIDQIFTMKLESLETHTDTLIELGMMLLNECTDELNSIRAFNDMNHSRVETLLQEYEKFIEKEYSYFATLRKSEGEFAFRAQEYRDMQKYAESVSAVMAQCSIYDMIRRLTGLNGLLMSAYDQLQYYAS